MDPALKQRLLGAVVLIALAIIFLPMLFSGNAPNSDSVTANLEIPPVPTREFETRVLAVDAANEPTANLPAQTVAAPEPLATVDTKAPPRVDALPESAPLASSTPVQENTAAPAPSVEPPKPASDAQLQAGKAAAGRYLVHLGVYTAEGNAKDLLAALKKGGFAAFAEPVDFKGKPAQRVRVGPFADRAEAEAARIRIKQVRSDVPSSVIGVAGDAKADAQPGAAPAAMPGGWAVQLGAFATAEDANKLVGRLRVAGFAGFVDRFNAEEKTLWRVRVGPEVDRAGAEKLRESVKDKLKLDGMIVSQP